MPESRHRRRRGRVLPKAARSAGTLGDSRPRRKKVNKLYLTASALIAVLVIAGFAVGGLAGGGGGGNTGADTGSFTGIRSDVGLPQALAPAGPQGLNIHVPESQSVDYSTFTSVFPPTSGDHWATPADCGFYEESLPDERVVHNMEHGNIVVSYNFSDQAQVDQLRRVIDDIGLANDWGITRFYDKIPEGQVAVSSWGVLDTFEGIDENGIKSFFEYSGNLAPEVVPCSGAQQQHNR